MHPYEKLQNTSLCLSRFPYINYAVSLQLSGGMKTLSWTVDLSQYSSDCTDIMTVVTFT